MVIPVKPINEIEVKSEVSINDKILICDSETEEARLASKDELKGDKGDKGDTGDTGPQGPKGDDGEEGQPGYSPTATVEKVGDTATITITDKNGTTTAEVKDGEGNVNDVLVDGVSVLENKIARIDLSGKQDLLTSENAGTDISIVNGAGGDETVTGDTSILLEDAIEDGLNSVTLTGACETKTLPLGYTRVEYIASDGTNAYIDTGIIFKTFDYSVEIDVKFNGSLSSATPAMAWGFMGLSSNLPRWGFGGYTSKWIGSVNTTGPVGTTDNLRHTVVLEVSNINDSARYSGTLDGNTLYPLTSIPSPERYVSNNISSYLFARNNNNTAGNFANCQIYGFKVRKAGVLVNNYIPCINPSNAIGFYDTVNNTFIGATAGTLTAGDEYENINPTPDMPINIVSNNGVLKVINGQVGANDSVETVTDELGNTATAEMLLAVGNYNDTQSILDGEITRNVGIKVLDGTESWEATTGNYYSLLKTYLGTDSTVLPFGSLDIICTHYSVASVQTENKMLVGNSYVNWYVPTAFTTLASWKQYLSDQYNAGTPVIIVYPLATSTAETVTGQTLTTTRGDNTLTITQASIDNLPIEANYDKIGGLTINFVNDSGFITGINSTDVTTALGYTPADSSTLGTAATKDTGTSSGNVPVLDSNGHLANSTIPGVALTDTFTVSTSSDLTTLSSADQGDIAIVTSENKTYVLSQAPYSTAANWKEILAPTGGVTSVNGQTGAVTVPVGDVVGPASSTDGHLAVFDGATGKLLKDGGAMPSIPSITTISVTLTAIGWVSSTQTVSATGVTASNTVIVSPDPSDYSDYTDAEIYCSAQGSGTLTFTCNTEPSNDIDVNVVILG